MQYQILKVPELKLTTDSVPNLLSLSNFVHFSMQSWTTVCNRWLFNFDPKTTFKLSGSELNIKHNKFVDSTTQNLYLSKESWV